MFNFFYKKNTNQILINRFKINDFHIFKPIKEIVEVKLHLSKLTFLQQNIIKQDLKKLSFESKVNKWPTYIKILYSFLIRYLHYNKIKWIIMYSFINLVFLSSSTDTKRLFKIIIFLLPLRKHKRKLFRILHFFRKILLFLEINQLQAQLYFTLKGKLGQRGDSKKQKHSLNFISIRDHKFLTIYNHDGIGKSSTFGHTFFRIKNTPLFNIKKKIKLNKVLKKNV